MLNLLTILALEHRYIALIVSACIIVVSVTLIIIRYKTRTKIDGNNVDIVYPLKQEEDSTDNDTSNKEA